MRVVVSRLALGLALILSIGVADARADSSKCDEVIADPDSGCSQGERCDAGTITFVKGGSEDTSDYVEICHRPPGCPGNTRTIRVSACALDGHLGHGDSIGACPECDSDHDCATGEVCNLSTGFCIDPDGSCDDDSDCGGHQICNPETGLCQDPTDECAVDAACDDGIFCNGAETCDAENGCAAGTAVELEECSHCVCDVNGDGAVTATDTLMMLRQVVGMGDLFVCPESAEPDTTTTTVTSTTTTTLQELP